MASLVTTWVLDRRLGHGERGGGSRGEQGVRIVRGHRQYDVSVNVNAHVNVNVNVKTW